MAGAFLLPGFFDCHVHICVPTDASDPSRLWTNALPGEIAIYAARAARRLLMCGITTAREVGGWDYHEIAVRESIGQGLIEGPRLYCAGKILTITSSTTPYYRGMYEEADGAEEVKKAARKQLAQGADLIKILATGAITSTKYEKAEAIQYRPEEIARRRRHRAGQSDPCRRPCPCQGGHPQRGGGGLPLHRAWQLRRRGDLQADGGARDLSRADPLHDAGHVQGPEIRQPRAAAYQGAL